MNPTRLALIAITVAFAAPSFAGGPVDKPEKAITCSACHGEAGISNSGIYPNLAGQYTNYLEHSLKDYRSGARKNAIMSAQAANLSDEEITQLAHWFNQQKGPLYTPSVHGALKN